MTVEALQLPEKLDTGPEVDDRLLGGEDAPEEGGRESAGE